MIDQAALPLEVLAFISRVRNCELSGACCRGRAAELLGEPVVRCEACSSPLVVGDVCPCLAHGHPGLGDVTRIHSWR